MTENRSITGKYLNVPLTVAFLIIKLQQKIRGNFAMWNGMFSVCKPKCHVFWWKAKRHIFSL